MMNLYVIGCGGIGGFVIDRLPMVISSLSLDLLNTAYAGYARGVLSRAGQLPQISAVDRLVLIDGDTFVPKNAVRQRAGAGSKVQRRISEVRSVIQRNIAAAGIVGESLKALEEAEARLAAIDSKEMADAIDILLDVPKNIGSIMESIQNSILKASFLQRMHLVGYNAYVNPGNFDKMIPKIPPPNPENAYNSQAWSAMSEDVQSRLSASVVFMCVDNMKTRYEVSKHMEKFDNCLVLNGGNSKTTGHVTVYERSGGKALDPPIYEVFGNINPDVDRRPDEIGCEEVAPEHDQIAVTNAMIADVMLARFVQWTREGLTKRVKDSDVRYNEVVMDIANPSLVPLYHRIKTNKEEEKECLS